jgi:phosphohistidine phosphatase
MQLNRLILIRHGAAAGRAASGGDRERALSPEGRRAISTLAPRLAPFGAPQSILCSPARRTRETLEILIRALNWTVAPAWEDRLYPGDNLALPACLREIDDASEQVVVVGHNPDIAEFAAHLGDSPELREFRPGAAAVFETSDPWSKLESAQRPILIAYYVP